MKSASDQLSAVTTAVMEEATRKVLAAAQRDVRLKEDEVEAITAYLNKLKLQHQQSILASDAQCAAKTAAVLDLEKAMVELKSRILESDINVKSKERELVKLAAEHEAAGKAGYDAGHEAGRVNALKDVRSFFGATATPGYSSASSDAAVVFAPLDDLDLDLSSAFAGAHLDAGTASTPPGAPATPDQSLFATPHNSRAATPTGTPATSPRADTLRANLRLYVDKLTRELADLKKHQNTLLSENEKLVGTRAAMEAELDELRFQHAELKSLHVQELGVAQSKLDRVTNELQQVRLAADQSASHSDEEVKKLKDELAAAKEAARLAAAKETAAANVNRERLVALRESLKRQFGSLKRQLGEINKELGDEEPGDEEPGEATGVVADETNQSNEDGGDDYAEEHETKDDDGRMSVRSNSTATTATTATSNISKTGKKGQAETVKRVSSTLNVTFPVVGEPAWLITPAKVLTSYKHLVKEELNARGHCNNLALFSSVFRGGDNRIDWYALAAAVFVRVVNDVARRLPTCNELRTFLYDPDVQNIKLAWKTQQQRWEKEGGPSKAMRLE
jgi:chromosome segregation ATPase